MNDITTARELALLAYTRWFKDSKTLILTELCISLLQAKDKLDEAKDLLMHECQNIEVSSIVEHIPDDSIFDNTLQMIMMQVIRN